MWRVALDVADVNVWTLKPESTLGHCMNGCIV